MKDNKEVEYVGLILSEATAREATCQLLESAERGGIREGMLLVVESKKKKLLGRVAEIIPFNAFYTAGDAFSEPRRKGLPIPEDVARRYEICKLDLLIGIQPKAEIKYPPQPGDKVLKLDPKVHEKDIYGVAKGDSKHVWYGSLSGYIDAPIPLNVENVPMHMAVFGVTGSGKSFDCGALIEQLVNIPKKKRGFVSYPMVIIDSHGDYVDYVDYWSKGIRFGRFGWIKRLIFPIAYVRPKFRRSKFIEPIAINLDFLPPRELAEIIILFYKGTIEGAELQINGLDYLFECMRADGYDSLQDVFRLHFNELKQRLANISTDEISRPTNSTINRALNEFITIETKHQLLSTPSPLQDKKFVDEITGKNGIAIVDFSADAAPGIDLKTKQFIMTYLASMLFERFTRFKIEDKEKYLIFMIEEAQNYCPDKSFPIGMSLAHNKLSAIATQGRKFGLSLCIVSQRPSFVDRIVLSQCNSFFIHRVAPEDVSFVRSITGGLPKSLSNRLTNLDKGEVIVTGQINTVPFALDIRIPNMKIPKKPVTTDEEIKKEFSDYLLAPHKLPGRKVPHTVGKTRVVENL